MSHNKSGIRISLALSKLGEGGSEDAASPLSIWMYVAGLIVSLSGLYAVTEGVPDQNYAMILHILVICGYATSYWMRRNNISLTQYRAPLFVLFVTILYFVASTSSSLTTTVLDNGSTRTYNLQVLIVWIVVLQSYTLNSNPSILFACVPSLALLGIMGSSSLDDEVQYAFLVFIAAATFLMIHENFLRTRSEMRGRSALTHEGSLFSSQLLLSAICVVGALLLAGILATPIQMIGRRVNPALGSGTQDSKVQSQNASSSNLKVNEVGELRLGTGPMEESDQLILLVESPQNTPLDGLYWRGMTLDTYDGKRFVDHPLPLKEILPTQPAGSVGSHEDLFSDPFHDPQFYNTFEFRDQSFDLGTGQMRGAREVVQTVTVLSGNVSQIYGAASFERVLTAKPVLRQSDAGGLSLESMRADDQYLVVSLVPDSRPDTLRRADDPIPESILGLYTQVAYDGHPENQQLKRLADEMTAGKSTEYDKAMAIRDAIARRCKYNLQTPAQPDGVDSVEYFLEVEKQGYCNSFAAAMTILCRYAGIPARVASGFVTGDLKHDGSQHSEQFEVREKHKHAWTEVYFADIGWIPFDATKGTDDITPSHAPDTKRGFQALQWLTSHGNLPPVLFCIVLVLLGYLVKTELMPHLRRRGVIQGHYASLFPTNLEILAHYAAACTLLSRKGLRRELGVTPNEFASQVRKKFEGASIISEEMAVLTRLHEKFCYGPAEARAADLATAGQSLQRLKMAVRALRG